MISDSSKCSSFKRRGILLSCMWDYWKERCRKIEDMNTDENTVTVLWIIVLIITIIIISIFIAIVIVVIGKKRINKGKSNKLIKGNKR
jgi:heme/copper-type cytochrome/quinol oxidase subunit 2